MKTHQEIKPSKQIWDYYNRGEICAQGVTMELILSSIADVIAGYHISRSATELLKDLGYIKVDKNEHKRITKLGKLVLSHELHERYHRGVEKYHIIVNPNSNTSASSEHEKT